ncbi:hypothetical protein J1N35_001518 [Gossypium stocksii]|uniref:Endonuclease/exonuclease/phosphatase domain-containing protein n=1 Tax=Gossypium stocksii TaxID=47602 RepID=A0A9D4AJP4_9ROSI|nr:hypothetical protein J1N35_001518 [Gossypium stocksii]
MSRLQSLLKQHNPQLVFFMETKVDGKRMEKIRRRCGFPNGIEARAEGSRGGICLAWKEDCEIFLKRFSLSYVDVLVKDGAVDVVWRFTGFYGSPYMQDKTTLWNLLRSLSKEQNFPWLVYGDFNEIMYSFEKIGGQPREEKRMEAFRDAFVPGRLIFNNVLIAYEILQHCARNIGNQKCSLRGVKASRRGSAISHLLFADDCILFGEATIGGARMLKDILKIYESCSGQCVNFNKSVIFYSSNTMEGVKYVISKEMGVRSSTNMEKYLGLPSVMGKRKKEVF